MDAAHARLDHRRPARTGEPEVVFGEGKTPEQVAGLLDELLRCSDGPVLATRCMPAHAEAALDAGLPAVYDAVSRLLVARRATPAPSLGTVAVACAGTSDLPVAQEAMGTLDAFGVAAQLVADVGVAGIHRVLDASADLAAADVCVVVAGMEAALPSVVAGLVAAPVIAVPTSVGYGAAFEGLAALLGMLTACAPGIAVVNIDNGFGAALVARRILATRTAARSAAPAAPAAPTAPAAPAAPAAAPTEGSVPGAAG
jgi:pyridinium-3,5-biscarboxylic acid mononucleotide synthase